jgi:hypothetical protein
MPNRAMTLFMNSEDVRTWSLEEANEAIPIITKAFDGIFALSERAEALTKDIAVLQEIWGAGLLEPSNPDYKYYKELRQRRAALQVRIELAVGELRRLGCAVDDIKRGVVHFYHKSKRGPVVFCWRYGEQCIRHWHELGWASRKPVGTLRGSI